MRNLELWDLTVNKLKITTEEKFAVCRGHDEDSTASALYVCGCNLIVKNYSENGEIRWSKDLSKIASPMNRPVNITCLSLQNILCLGLRNGELLTISEAGKSCDLTGVFNSGLLAMEWSPDQELLALVTKEMNTVLLSCTFDPVNEVNLWDPDFGEKQFITVGWGKKETQFHGSAGKQAAKLKDDFYVDHYPVSDDTVKITWRGDGHLYAIGFSIDGIRRFKIFDREGHLQYTSEKVPGLQSNIAWRPSGNVIATTQKIGDKYTVSFFEKNGLKHREFNLDVNGTTQVIDLSWSTDSEILTVHCKDNATNTQKLLLYTTGNYHWYLKQTLIFEKDQKLAKVMWDTDFDVSRNKKLHVILQNGQHLCYTWVWNINHSNGKTANDDSIVAVIDGNKLLLTGFRQTVVPPPMAALEISFANTVNSVHFAPKHFEQTIDPNSFFVFTMDNKLIFYEETQKVPLEFKQQRILEFEKFDIPLQYYNWYWVTTDKLVCVTLDKENSYLLVEYTINGDTLIKKHFCVLPSGVTRIQPHPCDFNILFLQLNNGEIVQYKLSGDVEPRDISFNVACPKFSVIEVGDKLHFIGVTHKGMLYIDGVVVMPSVSSFFIHTHFILITTLQHVLLCTELTESGLNAIKDYQNVESDHVYKRKVERGAKIVIVVPCDTRTIFQMPRGNLEAIQPRPLSLKIIGEYLDSSKYYEAFDLMRKQRINLNLIYDHDPNKFIKNIDLFLDSIKNNSWLNLFLSDLENSDVTKTMYSSSYVGKGYIPNYETHAKIENICNMIREHINKRPDSDTKVLPLITTHVKRNTVEELEKALNIIKELKKQETKEIKLPVTSDEALKYLLYMVDVNKLFDVALGMYDFDLVLLVANKSQKDPKEFIPMLNEMNDMDENYKRFTINKHLKRFDKAVQYLVSCGPSRHTELITFVKYHSLYKEALGFFETNEEIFKQVSDSYGLYLRLKKQFVQAGIVYERAKSFDNAIECFKDALEWQMALKLAYSWPENQFNELCWYFVKSLEQEKRHDEALLILERFCDNYNETISYAARCGHYRTALRLCAQYHNDNLEGITEEFVLPTLLEDCQNIKDLIEANWSTFIKHRERLLVVRQIKKENPIEAYDSYAFRDSDLYSDAGSTLASSSRGSARSYRSSKNRRKHERKVASLKEGSQYEDVALVIALHSLISSSFALRPQVKEILVGLSSFGKEKEAIVLQALLDKLLKEMKDSFRTIWTNELMLEAAKACIAVQNLPEGNNIISLGIESLEPHLRIAPVITEINWKLNGLNV